MLKDFLNSCDMYVLYTEHSDGWLLGGYAVCNYFLLCDYCLAVQYLYNAVWSHWNCTSCGIVKTSFHHRWFLAHLNHVRGQISFYLVKYFGAEQIQVTPNLIYVYSGRVVHFWFHYIIKHFLLEYPVSNLLEKVKDLDAGLITKYL